MIRIIVRHDNAGMAANVGGQVLTTFKTFDIEAPQIEVELLMAAGNIYAHSQIIGVEVVHEEPKP